MPPPFAAGAIYLYGHQVAGDLLVTGSAQLYHDRCTPEMFEGLGSCVTLFADAGDLYLYTDVLETSIPHHGPSGGGELRERYN